MYAIEVDHPLKGWTRLQARYANKKLARGWMSFVKKAWRGLPLRIVKVDAATVDGPVFLAERTGGNDHSK